MECYSASFLCIVISIIVIIIILLLLLFATMWWRIKIIIIMWIKMLLSSKTYYFTNHIYSSQKLRTEWKVNNRYQFLFNRNLDLSFLFQSLSAASSDFASKMNNNILCRVGRWTLLTHALTIYNICTWWYGNLLL